jgi:hypothetical protein
MDRQKVYALLRRVARGETGVDEACELLGDLPFKELAGITLDTHRGLRTGQGEVVLGLGKTPAQTANAVGGLAQGGTPVLATRLGPEQGALLARTFPQGRFFESCGLFCLGVELALDPPWPREGELLVASAGTSDESVALEALGAAMFFGLECGFLPDVGVAGLHRLLACKKSLDAARLLIVVAGMDGVLPSVTAGLTGKPVIAVPTSVGYGAAFGGVAALLGMLNSCAPGVAVVNIDNGFGAAAMAARILGTF